MENNSMNSWKSEIINMQYIVEEVPRHLLLEEIELKSMKRVRFQKKDSNPNDLHCRTGK